MYPNNKYFKIYSEICENFDINYYNIIYIKNNNSKDETKIYFNKNYYNLFNKNNFYNKKLNKSIKYTNIKLLNEDKEDNIINLIKSTKYKNESESVMKLLFKISSCSLNKKNIEKITCKFEGKILKLSDSINEFTEFMKDKNIYNLFEENYSLLYKYLTHIKIYNIYISLLDILRYNPDNFCSQVKIYYEQFKTKRKGFNYIFESLFELIFGFEINNEQMDRYIQIINSYNKDKYEEYDKEIIPDEYNNIVSYIQTGGYPLHHFMMGKGKQQ
jgi:hypothetical protein